MLKNTLDHLITIILMLFIGYAIYSLFLSPEDNEGGVLEGSSQISTDAFFAASLQDQDNMTQALSQYKGKTIVVNFWATWCPPCREEMPELSALHTQWQEKGVMVLGIAIDELALVQAFSETSPVAYPLLVAEDEGVMMATHLGNDRGGVPYTVLINPQGQLVKTYFGKITKSIIEADLNTLL